MDDPQKDIEKDEIAASRKEDHIDMAFKANMGQSLADPRFHYEPMLSGHKKESLDLNLQFAGKQLNYPIWVSSMTGGTERAKNINHNLARICGEYGLGMGLGSCRQLLYDDQRLSEFDVRDLMPNNPLFINLGIAQIEQLIEQNESGRIKELINKLRSDGLIIHINPLQEWLQPEGDVIKYPPLVTVKKLLEIADYPIIVKEVGQGFGPESLKALLELPIAAIELAGYGGTNFSKLELMRAQNGKSEACESVLHLGHNCEEMIHTINSYCQDSLDKKPLIIMSGGVRSFLDGYYLMSKCKLPSIYAQASGFLKHALNMDDLEAYVKQQISGLEMAHALLKVKV